MKVIVQKFGGTSLSTSEMRERAAQKIINAEKCGFHPVVVVSAIGRKDNPYATDTLIDFVEEIYPDAHPRDFDLIMSCGEIISCVAMTNTLKSKGYEGVALTGGQAGILTNKQYGSAEIVKINPEKVLDIVKSGGIPIIAGFQGMTEDGEITTLGRGGSDITAVSFGEALSASLVEIYTDVEGIMTADPKIVPNASLLKHISYSEVFEIAEQGAKIIHPRAVESAMRSWIPIVIKNTMNDSPGTVISSCRYREKGHTTSYNDIVTGITHILGRTQIIIKDLDAKNQRDILLRFAENHISIDLISIFPDKIIFTIEGYVSDKAKTIMDQYDYDYSMIYNCSKISAVGDRMRGVPGVMYRVINALLKKNIEILQTADSHSSISCLVRGEDTNKAVISLHEEFKLHTQ